MAAQAISAQQATRADALALEQAGHTTEAAQVWTALAQSNPKNPEPPAHLGLLEARQEHFASAIAFYKQALALKPDLPGLQMNLGLACFKAGRFPEAIHAFQAEARKHPDAPDPRLGILFGMSHFGMGDYLVAIPYLRQAAERDPASLPLRLTLAHSCLWSKQYACVLDVYKEILALNADSAEADMLAGEALDETGDSTGAIAQFRSAIRANPKEPNAHFGLGYLLWKENKFAEAAEEFEAELSNDPSQVQARAYLGDALCELNQYKEAEPELERAIAGDPTSAMAHRDLGVVYASAGRTDEAISHLQHAVTLDPHDVAPHWRLAKLYQATGKKEEAKLEFATASQMKRQENQALADKISGAPPVHP